MKAFIATALIVTSIAPALAQAPVPSFRNPATIQSALESRAVAKHAERDASIRKAQAASTTTNEGPWPKRHAILLGALTGFVGGFVIGAATCKYPTAEGDSCSDYTYSGNARLLGGWTIGGVGAAIGAGVGAIIKASR